MSESLAIVLAGIGGAIVTGVVGILSSTISLRAARRQMESQIQDNEKDRKHQAFMTLLQRKQAALESIWELLFVLERSGALSEQATQQYIRNLMWLPTNLQQVCLSLLHKDGGPSIARSFSRARHAIMEQASSIEISYSRPEDTSDRE